MSVPLPPILSNLNKDLEIHILLFTSSQSSSVSDIDHLQNRVDETGREKCDHIGVVSRRVGIRALVFTLYLAHIILASAYSIASVSIITCQLLEIVLVGNLNANKCHK